MKSQRRIIRALRLSKHLFIFLTQFFLPLSGIHFGLWEWQGPLRRTCYQSTSYEVAYYQYWHGIVIIFAIANVILKKVIKNMTINIDIAFSDYSWNCFSFFPLRMDVYHLIGNDFIKRGRCIVSPYNRPRSVNYKSGLVFF